MEPQGDGVAFLRKLEWRRGALRLGFLALILAGLAQLAGDSALGLLYTAGGVMGLALAHRRLYPVLVWTGVAAHGCWLLLSGTPAGVWLAAVAILASVLAYLPDARFRLPAAVVDELSRLPSLATLPVAVAVAVPDPVARPPALPVVGAETDVAALTVRSIGRFQLLAGDRDLTNQLLKMKVLRFTWIYLLARSVVDDGFLARDDVALRVTPPRIKGPTDRLRDHLRDLRDNLPEGLSRPIDSTDKLVRFDASACDWDVARLLRLQARCLAAASEVLPRELALELEQELAQLAPGDFLPEWDTYERVATLGNLNEDLIRDVRFKVANLRTELTFQLGRSLLEQGRAADAVAPLEAELGRSGDPRIAEALIKALHQTGHHARAGELRRKYDRGEV